MSKKVSSKEDLFLSALDLYTLLSMIFIILAFSIVKGWSGLSLTNLPADSGRKPSGIAERNEVIKLIPHVEWSVPTPSIGDDCQIVIVTDGQINDLDGTYTVPCYPVFDPEGSPSTPSDQLRKASAQWAKDALENETLAMFVKNGSGPIRIRCNVRFEEDDPFVACARLQWVMSDHDFFPLIEKVKRTQP